MTLTLTLVHAGVHHAALKLYRLHLTLGHTEQRYLYLGLLALARWWRLPRGPGRPGGPRDTTPASPGSGLPPAV